MAALTYADIKKQQAAANPWLQGLSTEDFSRAMGRISGDETQYAAGVDPSWLSQLDYGINQVTEATGLPDVLGGLGKAAFGETGEHVFHGIPRAILNMAPMAIPGAGLGVAAARLGAMGAMTGLETWGATEKAGPSALAFGLGALTPAIMHKSGKLAVGAMKSAEDKTQATLLREMLKGVPEADTIENALRRATIGESLAAHTVSPTTTKQVLGQIAGSQVGLSAVQTGVEAVNIAADPERQMKELLSPEYWAAQVLAQGVFAGLDIARIPSMQKQAGTAAKALTTGDRTLAVPFKSPLEAPPADMVETLRLAGPTVPRLMGPVDDGSTIRMGGAIGTGDPIEVGGTLQMPGPVGTLSLPGQQFGLWDPKPVVTPEKMIVDKAAETVEQAALPPALVPTKPVIGREPEPVAAAEPATPGTPDESALQQQLEWVKDPGQAILDGEVKTMPAMTPAEPLVVDFRADRPNRKTYTPRVVRAKLKSELKIEHADVIYHVASDEYMGQLARTYDRHIRNGETPETATLYTLEVGRQHLHTTQRKGGAPPEKSTEWVEELNRNHMSERAELAKTDPEVAAEIEFIKQESAKYALADQNRGDTRIDPIHSKWRAWFDDGMPDGMAGLKRGVEAAWKMSARLKDKTRTTRKGRGAAAKAAKVEVVETRPDGTKVVETEGKPIEESLRDSDEAARLQREQVEREAKVAETIKPGETSDPGTGAPKEYIDETMRADDDDLPTVARKPDEPATVEQQDSIDIVDALASKDPDALARVTEVQHTRALTKPDPDRPYPGLTKAHMKAGLEAEERIDARAGVRDRKRELKEDLAEEIGERLANIYVTARDRSTKGGYFMEKFSSPEDAARLREDIAGYNERITRLTEAGEMTPERTAVVERLHNRVFELEDRLMDIEHPRPEKTDIEYGQEVLGAMDNPAAETQARLNALFVARANARTDGILEAGTFFGKLMRNIGMSEQDVANKLPLISRLYTGIKALKGIPMARMTTTGKKAYGFFAGDTRSVAMFSAGLDSKDILPFVVAHEITGHGLWQEHANGTLEPSQSHRLDRVKLFVEQALPETRAEMLRLMVEGLPHEITSHKLVKDSIYDPSNLKSADEVLANMNAIAALHFAGQKPSFMRDLIRFLPKPLGDFLSVASDYGSKIMRVLRGGFRDDPMGEILRTHEETMRDVMRADRENSMDATRLEAFARMTEPDGLLSMTKDEATAEDWFNTVFDTAELDAFANSLGNYMLKGTGLGKEAKGVGQAAGRLGMSFGRQLVHLLRPLQQIGGWKKDMRFFAEITARRERAQNELFNTLARLMSGRHTGALVSFAKDAPVTKMYDANDPVMIKVKDDIARWVNENDVNKERTDQGRTAYEHVIGNTPEVKAMMDTLGTEQQNLVKALFAQMGEVTKTFNTEITNLTYDYQASQIAAGSLFQVPGVDHGLRYQPVYEFYKRYTDQAKAGVPIDFDQMEAEGANVFKSTTITDPVLAAEDAMTRSQRARRIFETQHEIIQGQHAMRLANPGFISERRMGPVKVSYVMKGQTDLHSAETVKDGEQLKKWLESKGATNVVVDPVNAKAKVGDADMSALDVAMEEMILKSTQLAKSRGMSDADIAEAISLFDVRPQLEASRTTRDVTSSEKQRRFTPGREFLDMTQQQWQYTHAMIRQMTLKNAEAQVKGMTNDTHLRKAPEAQSILTGFANYKTPDTPAMRAISKFSYFMTLGLNTANWMQEMAQPMVAFPWKLVDEGAGVVQANRHVRKAYGEMRKVWLTKAYLKNGQFDFSKLSPDHQAVLTDALNNRTLEAAGYTEFEEGAITKQFRKGMVTQGQLEESIAQPITEAAVHAGQFATQLHNKATSLSTGVALLASYDFLRTRGLDHADALHQSYDLVKEGMLTAGREGRAAGIYNSGEFRPVASMMMALQGFSLGTVTQMAQYVGKSFRGDLSKSERGSARRAAAGMILTNVALAGVMGMPGIGAAMRLTQQATGFDFEKWLEGLSDMEQDPGAAAMMKSVALRGFSQLVGGPDVSQKYGLTSIMGFNEYDGFNLQNLFGPVGTYAVRGAGALGSLAQGKIGDAAEQVAPVFARKAVQLWNDDWQFRSPDNDEEMIRNPTLTEKIGYTLGFQPIRLNKARQVNAMARRAREAKYESDKRDADRIADAYMEQDMDEVKVLMGEEVKKAGHEFDLDALARKVADRVENKRFARDPGQQGTRFTSAEDEAVMRSLGVYAPTQELERGQARSAVMQALGARGVPQSSLEQYRQIDVLRKRQPFLTVPHAKAILERQRGGPKQPLPPYLQALMPQQ